MADTTIEWTNKTWNPTVGCTRISQGCKNCYAFALHDKRHAAYKNGKNIPVQYAKPFTELQLMRARLMDPIHWCKPCMVFVNSVSDLFHDDVPFDFIDRVFATMALCPKHTFQILTKRPVRMLSYFDGIDENGPDDILMRWGAAAGNLLDGAWVWNEGKRFRDAIEKFISVTHGEEPEEDGDEEYEYVPPQAHPFPLPNVWLGASVEDQASADERIPVLLKTPAAVRFLSCEPLLGAVDLRHVHHDDVVEIDSLTGDHGVNRPLAGRSKDRIDWVIVGGESGPKARPMHPDWARSIRDQCQGAGVPFFFKQWGEYAPCQPGHELADQAIYVSGGDKCGYYCDPEIGHVDHGEAIMVRLGKKAAGRLLDGKMWDEFP